MEKSQFVTDAEVTAYLNWGLSALDDLMVTLYEDYKISEIQETITSSIDGYNSFNLPADFLKARAMDRQFGGGVWHTMQRVGLPARNRGNGAFSILVAQQARNYRVQGTQVIVEPWQQAAGTYKLTYIPRFVPLANPSDTLPDYMDLQSWCQFAVIDAVIKILTKQDMDASQWQSQKSDLFQRITTAASVRDAGPPMSAEDWNGGSDRGGGYGWGF